MDCTSCYSQPITEANMGGNGATTRCKSRWSSACVTGLRFWRTTPGRRLSTTLPTTSRPRRLLPATLTFSRSMSPNFKRLDHGPSDFDHRNVVSISYVYVFPSVKDAPAAIRFLINGWQTSGLLQFRSGDPLTIASNSNNASGSGQNRDRAVLVGNPYGGNACGSTDSCKSYLNPASFQNNARGNLRQYCEGFLRRAAIYRLGYEPDSQLQHRERAIAAVSCGVFQYLQPHQLWRSGYDE